MAVYTCPNGCTQNSAGICHGQPMTLAPAPALPPVIDVALTRRGPKR